MLAVRRTIVIGNSRQDVKLRLHSENGSWRNRAIYIRAQIMMLPTLSTVYVLQRLKQP